MRFLPQILGVAAQVGVGMEDFGPGKPLFSETSHVLPRHPAFLATALEDSEPALAHFTPKALETSEIARNCVIIEVALYHTPQPIPDFRQRLIPTQPNFL